MKKLFLIVCLLFTLFISACGTSPTATGHNTLNSSHLDTFFDVNHSNEVTNHGEIENGAYKVEFSDGTYFVKTVEDDTSTYYTISYPNEVLILVWSDGTMYDIYFHKHQLGVTYLDNEYDFSLKNSILFLHDDNEFSLMDNGDIVDSGNIDNSDDKKRFNSYLIESGLPTELSAYDDFIEYAHEEAVEIFSKYPTKK